MMFPRDSYSGLCVSLENLFVSAKLLQFIYIYILVESHSSKVSRFRLKKITFDFRVELKFQTIKTVCKFLILSRGTAIPTILIVRPAKTQDRPAHSRSLNSLCRAFYGNQAFTASSGQRTQIRLFVFAGWPVSSLGAYALLEILCPGSDVMIRAPS